MKEVQNSRVDVPSRPVNLRDRGLHQYNVKETELEIETVKVQAKLFASFREQLENRAVRYHDQGKPKLEEILLRVLNSG